jgi:hypothetical protein
MSVTARRIGHVIADKPMPIPSKRNARCGSPNELLAHRATFGHAMYAVNFIDEPKSDKETWYFSNDLQDAAAIGLRWHENVCSLEQYPIEQDGRIEYGYRVRGWCNAHSIADTLYERWLWEAVGADMNEAATPEIMTRVRVELFKFQAHYFPDIMLLDFSQPDTVSRYLQDWADELEYTRK